MNLPPKAINDATTKIIQNFSNFPRNLTTRTWVSNFFQGVGISYSINEKKYWKVPIVILMPSLSFGYHFNKEYRLINLQNKRK